MCSGPTKPDTGAGLRCLVLLVCFAWARCSSPPLGVTGAPVSPRHMNQTRDDRHGQTPVLQPSPVFLAITGYFGGMGVAWLGLQPCQALHGLAQPCGIVSREGSARSTSHFSGFCPLSINREGIIGTGQRWCYYYALPVPLQLFTLRRTLQLTGVDYRPC